MTARHEPAEQLGDTTPGAFDTLPPLQEHPAITEAREATRLPGWFWLAAPVLLMVLFSLWGCGGGDWADEDGKVPPPGVDCQARPELCT